jgi:hypothetical protein
MATSMRGREYEIQAHSESDGCYCHEAEDLGGLIHSSDALELNILHRSFLFFAPAHRNFLPTLCDYPANNLFSRRNLDIEDRARQMNL